MVLNAAVLGGKHIVFDRIVCISASTRGKALSRWLFEIGENDSTLPSAAFQSRRYLGQLGQITVGVPILRVAFRFSFRCFSISSVLGPNHCGRCSEWCSLWRNFHVTSLCPVSFPVPLFLISFVLFPLSFVCPSFWCSLLREVSADHFDTFFLFHSVSCVLLFFEFQLLREAFGAPTIL